MLLFAMRPGVESVAQQDVRCRSNELDDGREVFDAALTHKLIEPRDRILLEMGAGTVRIERLAVLVLLINKDRIGLIFDPMGNIREAARLLARSHGKFLQNLGDLRAVLIGEAHAYGKADHRV
jgi:hypothetical protein